MGRHCFNRKSKAVTGDTHVLYITEPQGFALKNASCEGAEIQKIKKRKGLRQISILSRKNGFISRKLALERVL
jgi:hypothetical protein